MQDMLNSRKRGDMAFREKDFKTAIDCYTQVYHPPIVHVLVTCFKNDGIGPCVWKFGSPREPHFCNITSEFRYLQRASLQFVDVGTMISPTVFARRSLSYLLSDQAEAALRDAMQAQYVHPEWPTAFFMQAAALTKLGMDTDAKDMLKEGSMLHTKTQTLSN